MIETIDHLIIAVQDLDEAEENYKKIFGIPPVWKGIHKELGTANAIFNFKNTYFELLSANGDGLGADLVNNQLKEIGEGMLGLVLGTEDINSTAAILKDKGFPISEVSNGEGKNSQNDEIRKWKNIFLPPELTRGIFSFIILRCSGSSPNSPSGIFKKIGFDIFFSPAIASFSLFLDNKSSFGDPPLEPSVAIIVNTWFPSFL